MDKQKLYAITYKHFYIGETKEFIWAYNKKEAKEKFKRNFDSKIIDIKETA